MGCRPYHLVFLPVLGQGGGPGLAHQQGWIGTTHTILFRGHTSRDGYIRHIPLHIWGRPTGMDRYYTPIPNRMDWNCTHHPIKGTNQQGWLGTTHTPSYIEDTPAGIDMHTPTYCLYGYTRSDEEVLQIPSYTTKGGISSDR